MCERKFPELSTGKTEAGKQLCHCDVPLKWKNFENSRTRGCSWSKTGDMKKSVFVHKHETNMMDENRISTALASQQLQIHYSLAK